MMYPHFWTTTLSRRNKFCFTGGMIEGKLDFVIDLSIATSHLLFSSRCTASWKQ